MAVKLVTQDLGIQAGLSEGLSGVAFANCCDGVAVGRDGAVMTTSDGGVSWTFQPSGFKGHFRDVAFAEANRMVAVGDEGTILISDDKGATWSSPSTISSFPDPTNFMLLGVGFKDQTGYAVGTTTEGIQRALVLTTNDSGDTWSSQIVLPESATLMADVTFNIMDDVPHVVAVGQGTTGIIGLIIRAEIGTTSWSIPQVLPSPTTDPLYGVDFAKTPNERHGWAVGRSGAIVHTTDGGQTWAFQTSGIPNVDLLRVAAIDEKRAWAVGSDGMLIATSDAGENWMQHDTGLGFLLSDLAFCGPCLGTIVGGPSTVLTVLGQTSCGSFGIVE
ncbi:photosystem II stability/assembly factor-like uncharacterized protein [Nitrosomonas sp. Nm84]|uniref:YCF48-related protein n=1 Tax=Nitrosomonas sp. Nm84 TaxID=200124 RepID=UPI000D752510|nr:YCF48-related protein [Nitrosomonas sp. Nm84]PXW89074.1 photosystem II stability/assembly factor-like uncharacterized protein [Nitrosomonas sp. Nm84]